jgi:ABC-2 type transport system ATP-binding protein
VTVDPAISATDLVMQFPQQQGWRALFKKDPGKVALDHVTLEVEPGELFGLLGPNGAGKTTLVKILSTLSIPSGGRASVGGLDVVRHSVEVRKRLGVVYGDERTFFWRLSVLDNLLYYASLYRIPGDRARERAWELLDLVGLSASAQLRMHHFSSGMKQRASIARGLLNDPDILIMDEPTRSLDPVAALDLRTLVKERVLNERRTVLLATNIMSEAEHLCDRMAFINRGRIELSGQIEQLRDRLQADEVHEMVVSGLAHARIESLIELPGVDAFELTPLADERTLIAVSVRRGLPIVPEILRCIIENGGDVWSCSERELSLEEMFTLVVKEDRAEAEREKVPA